MRWRRRGGNGVSGQADRTSELAELTADRREALHAGASPGRLAGVREGLATPTADSGWDEDAPARGMSQNYLLSRWVEVVTEEAAR